VNPTTPADAAQPARRQLAWLLLAALLVLGAGLGLRDPWPADEPRFALVAQQMVASGDWLFPHRGSELYSDKPPLLMWLQAALLALTGELRIAFLLPSLLAGLATLALVWDLGRRLFSPRAGLLAAIGVLSALMFTYQFKRAQIDPLITVLITLANWGLLRHLLLGPDWRAFWLGCFAAGLGVITKGVGVIALLMLLPYALLLRRGWQGLAAPGPGHGWHWAGGALAFLGAIALWLVPMAGLALTSGSAEHRSYMMDILFNQTARRYAGQVGGHQQPFWYFVPVVLLHFFPLSLAYFSAWADARAAWARRDGRVMLLLGWCALVFLFFSLAGGKREVYLLPMLPMLALALGPTLVRMADAPWLNRTALAATVLLGVLIAGYGAALASGRLTGAARTLAERGLAEEAPALAKLALLAGALFLLGAAVFRARRGTWALLGGLAGLWLVWGLGVGPVANDEASAAGAMRRADQLAGPQGEIGLVGWREQHRLMSVRPPKDFGFSRSFAEQFDSAAAWLREAPDRRWLFARQAAVAACVDPAKVVPMGATNRLQWWMLRADALKPGCRIPAAGTSAAPAEPDPRD